MSQLRANRMIAMLGCILPILGQNVAVAQTKPAAAAEIELLKTQLSLLDKQMREVRDRLAAIEARQFGPAATPVPALEAYATVTPPISAEPQPKYLGAATAGRETASQNETTAPRIDNESIDRSMRGYLRLPGTNTMLKVGGFVKNDLFLDVNYAGSYYGAFVPSSFPSSPQPKAKNATVSMRSSRIFLEMRQPTGDGNDPSSQVKAYVEVDFLGNYDRTSLRLRQFYAQYKNLLVGQTWSAFGDPDAFPDTLEFEGPPGLVGIRQPQIRYTRPLNAHNSIGISLEKSGTDTPFSTQFGSPVGTSNRPDLVAFYRFENALGHTLVSTLFRSVGGVISGTTNSSLQAQRNAYGVSVSNVWTLGSHTKDNIQVLGIIGRGISNYYNDNFGFGSDVDFSATGRLVAVPSGSAEVGYQHYWSSRFRSTATFGYLKINNTAAAPPSAYQTSYYSTANLIYQPSHNVLLGGELVYGRVERKNGFAWESPRIQFTAQYFLNKYRQ